MGDSDVYGLTQNPVAEFNRSPKSHLSTMNTPLPP